MARLSAVFTPAKDGSASVSATSAGTAVTLGTNVVFAFNATQDCAIAFGNSTGTVASASSANFRIPAGVMAVYDLGQKYDQFQVYNLGASTATVYWQQLSIN